MKDIFLYSTLDSWVEESPDATIRGIVHSKNSNFIEISDEKGYTQIINLDKLFAVVY
jgi:hypothetical protein